MNDDIAIKVENVSKTFQIHHNKLERFKDYFLNIFKKKEKPTQFHVLKNISFEIKKGEFFGIIGKNGSGKSTLLKIIASIYLPDAGTVSVSGSLVPFLELGVGFNLDLTARENIYLNGVILGMTKKEIREKYEEILDFAEVTEFEDMQLKTFSSGMLVRLAFSIAIQRKADIYLLDEIFAVGDAGFQEKSLNVIKEFIKQGKTFIFVGHDLGAIREFGTNAIYIKDHEVYSRGLESLELYEKEIMHG